MAQDQDARPGSSATWPPVNPEIAIDPLPVNRVRQGDGVQRTGQRQVQQDQRHKKTRGIRRRIQHTEIVSQAAVDTRDGLAVGFLFAQVTRRIFVILQDRDSGASAR